MKKITRNEVASLAQVSSATVSRVYNNPESVSADKRDAVIQASDKLGYSPDKSASSLRRNGTGRIALLDFKGLPSSYNWYNFPVFKWFYSDVISGIQEIINNTMYQLNIESLKRLSDINRFKGLYDGLICFDVEDEKTAEAVKKTGIPYIISHHTINFEGYNSCSTDNYAGGVIQGEMLKEGKGEKPVYISGFTDKVFSHSQRYKGFKTVYPDAPLIDTGIGMDAGRKAASTIIKQLIRGDIDSIAVVNDFTAAGVYYHIKESGLRVPEEIRIVSYDNMPLNSIMPEPFSTVDINPSQIYEKAADLLINKIMKGIDVSETVNPSPVPGKTVTISN